MVFKWSKAIEIFDAESLPFIILLWMTNDRAVARSGSFMKKPGSKVSCGSPPSF
jgi:hypothetical protein